MHDETRVYSSSDRAWIPIPLVPKGEAFIKVIHADPELHKVIFKFRFGPGTELPAHTHHCHAIAYTISGEWAYEGFNLPEGAVAYEPVDSTHMAFFQTLEGITPEAAEQMLTDLTSEAP